MTRFTIGDTVEILALGKAGHVRIPHYIRQHLGEVVQYCGAHKNPEDLALGKTDGAEVDLYRVSFPQSALWPAEDHAPQDRLILEVYDHWLSPKVANHAP